MNQHNETESDVELAHEIALVSSARVMVAAEGDVAVAILAHIIALRTTVDFSAREALRPGREPEVYIAKVKQMVGEHLDNVLVRIRADEVKKTPAG